VPGEIAIPRPSNEIISQAIFESMSLSNLMLATCVAKASNVLKI
jgi:hypothetical protein